MKRMVVKKTVAILMAVIMLSIAGCGEQGTGNEHANEMVFEGTKLPLEEVEGEIGTFFIKHNKLYINTGEWIKEGGDVADETLINRVYVANLDGSDVEEISLPKLNRIDRITNMLVDDVGNIIFFILGWDISTEKEVYCILKVDAKGKELCNEDITETLKLPQEDYVTDVVLDDKGRLVIVTGTTEDITDIGQESVYVLNENGELLCEIKSDSITMGHAVKTKNGNIVCGVSVVEGVKAQVLDIDHKQWGERIELWNWNHVLTIDSLIDGIDSMKYDFYYKYDLKEDSGIYGYDMAQRKGTKVIDCVTSNLSFENIIGMVMINEDQLLGIEQTAEGKSSLVLYKKVIK